MISLEAKDMSKVFVSNDIYVFASFWKQIKNLMQKGIPKVNLLDPFSGTRLPRVDLFWFVARFGAMPKKYSSFDRPKIVQKIFKPTRINQSVKKTAQDFRSGGGLDGPGPVSGHARHRTI